jgi:hypothetical protein
VKSERHLLSFCDRRLLAFGVVRVVVFTTQNTKNTIRVKSSLLLSTLLFFIVGCATRPATFPPTQGINSFDRVKETEFQKTAILKSIDPNNLHFTTPTNASSFLQARQHPRYGTAGGTEARKFSLDDFRYLMQQADSTNYETGGTFDGPHFEGEGAVLSPTGELLFWKVTDRASVFLASANGVSIVLKSSAVKFYSPVSSWPRLTDPVRVPQHKEIDSIDISPRVERWLGDAGVSRQHLCNRIVNLLDQHTRQDFDNYHESFSARLHLKAEKGRPLAPLPSGWTLSGVMITNQREMFFWELYLDKYLFLQDVEGRMCWLSPKKR